MWNRGFRILSIKLQIENRKFFGFPFPIPMFVFQELMDSFTDLLTFACLFVPKTPYRNVRSQVSIHAVRELVQMTTLLLNSLTSDEPYDLVEVATDNVKVIIRIQ